MAHSGHRISDSPYCPPVDVGLEVVFEDSELLIVNKPAGLLSVPGRGEDKHDSLAVRVRRHRPGATIMHRLDMNTSGLIIFACGRIARQSIQNQFESRTIDKMYYARVHGTPLAQSGTIDAPMRCDWPMRPKQIIDPVLGKEAISHYRVISSGTQALLQLTPQTGRSHQLRVHLASIGHPILGDQLYGCAACKKFAQLYLHATRLVLVHPVSKKELVVKRSPYWLQQ